MSTLSTLCIVGKVDSNIDLHLAQSDTRVFSYQMIQKENLQWNGL